MKCLIFPGQKKSYVGVWRDNDRNNSHASTPHMSYAETPSNDPNDEVDEDKCNNGRKIHFESDVPLIRAK